MDLKPIAAMAVSLAVGGCTPIGKLVEQRRFEEAMCGARSFSRNPERELAKVQRAINRAARPRIHLQALPRAELVDALGEAGARLADRAVVVRAVSTIDPVSAGSFEIGVVLEAGGRPVTPVAPHLEPIAALLGEQLPAAEVYTTPSRREIVASRFRERPLLGGVMAGLEVATLTLVPFTLVSGHTRIRAGTTTVIEPTDAEIAAAAPATAAFIDGLAAYSFDEYDEAEVASMVWLWPRPTAPVDHLVVHWGFSTAGCVTARPAMKDDYESPSVELVDSQRIVLPPGPDLESRINARFGTDMLFLESR